MRRTAVVPWWRQHRYPPACGGAAHRQSVVWASNARLDQDASLRLLLAPCVDGRRQWHVALWRKWYQNVSGNRREREKITRFYHSLHLCSLCRCSLWFMQRGVACRVNALFAAARAFRHACARICTRSSGATRLLRDNRRRRVAVCCAAASIRSRWNGLVRVGAGIWTQNDCVTRSAGARILFIAYSWLIARASRIKSCAHQPLSRHGGIAAHSRISRKWRRFAARDKTFPLSHLKPRASAADGVALMWRVTRHRGKLALAIRRVAASNEMAAMASAVWQAA